MKEFLSQRGVPYIEKYVDRDRAAAIEMIRRSGQQGVPVTVLGDEVVVGFDRPRLERILAAIQAKGAERSERKPLGAKVADAARYALSSEGAVHGAYVGGVKPGSPAEEAGVRVGDIIVAIGDTPIDSAEELSRVLSRLSPGRTVLKLRRGPGTRTVAIEL